MKKINHNYEIKKLSKSTDFMEVWSSEYYREYFIKRYINDLPRFAFEVAGIELTHQQIDIWNTYRKSGGFMGGRLGVASGHGTGKTKFIGIISILHLLCFSQSITRIQAPTLAQVTSSSFKEVTEVCIALKRGIKINGKTYASKWGFLLDFIQINVGQIYIKNYKTSWLSLIHI